MPRIVKTEGVLGGDPRIEGHRIGVHHVYQRYVEGDDTPEEIATGYGITLAEVHTALAYAFCNSDEMREIRSKREDIDDSSEQRVLPEDADR